MYIVQVNTSLLSATYKFNITQICFRQEREILFKNYLYKILNIAIEHAVRVEYRKAIRRMRKKGPKSFRAKKRSKKSHGHNRSQGHKMSESHKRLKGHKQSKNHNGSHNFKSSQAHKTLQGHESSQGSKGSQGH